MNISKGQVTLPKSKVFEISDASQCHHFLFNMSKNKY